MPKDLARSFLHEIRVVNFGCIGKEGVTIALDEIVCFVGANNSGKSTILRAYEAAVNLISLKDSDFCTLRDGEPAIIELSVHIPEGTPNIDEEWKDKVGDLSLVKSRWIWEQPGKPKRQTYDPAAKDWAEEGKAAGIDQVFSSRLPQPFRIEALDGPTEEHSRLLTLILQPIADELDKLLKDEEADVSKKREEFIEAAKAPVKAYKAKIDAAQKQVAKSYAKIFNAAEIELKVDMSPPDIKAMDSLLKGSSLKIIEHGSECSVHQQGTGSQRALFWSMLEVRSALKKELDAKRGKDLKQASLEKEIKKLKENPGKQPAKIAENKAKLEKFERELSELKSNTEDAVFLPGYMLLIDEPEIALHPNAVRAAKTHLYGLAGDEGWQVMISTHNPAFVDPTQDHTTIVRLERTKANPTPKLFRSDDVELTTDEKEELQMLLQFDPTVSELFFGSYPILVEGNTEYAGFLRVMQSDSDRFPDAIRPAIIRAVGKALIVPLIKILKHFKIAFSVLHDADTPKRSDGAKNGMWTENNKIFAAINACRESGLRVVHRVSIPDFERRFNLGEGKREKPFIFWKALEADEIMLEDCKKLLSELISSDSPESEYSTDKYVKLLTDAVVAWAKVNAVSDDRYKV